MRTTWKVLLGVVSLAPVLFFALFFFWLIPAFFAPVMEGAPSLFSQRFESLRPLALDVSAVLILLLLLYVTLLARRPDVHLGEKIGIPLVILFTNGIVLPVVWWLYIWRKSNLNELSRRRLTTS